MYSITGNSFRYLGTLNLEIYMLLFNLYSRHLETFVRVESTNLCLPPALLLSPLNDTAQIMIDSSVPTCSEGPDLRERSLGYDCFESSHFNNIVGLFTVCIKYMIQMR